MENQRQHHLEYYKAIFEYQKHLTSLSTGSILLISIFLEKLFSHPEWKSVVVLSLIGFLVSIVGSVITYTAFLENMPGNESGRNWPQPAKTLAGFGVLMSWAGFLIGLISLTAFAIKNLV